MRKIFVSLDSITGIIVNRYLLEKNKPSREGFFVCSALAIVTKDRWGSLLSVALMLLWCCKYTTLFHKAPNLFEDFSVIPQIFNTKSENDSV